MRYCVIFNVFSGHPLYASYIKLHTRCDVPALITSRDVCEELSVARRLSNQTVLS